MIKDGDDNRYDIFGAIPSHISLFCSRARTLYNSTATLTAQMSVVHL